MVKATAKPKRAKVEVVRGVHGHMALYVNDIRVAGSKPWGGGHTIHSFSPEVQAFTKDLEEALGR